MTCRRSVHILLTLTVGACGAHAVPVLQSESPTPDAGVGIAAADAPVKPVAYGVVTDTEGTPIAGALVVLVTGRDEKFVATRTSSDGRFEVPTIPGSRGSRVAISVTHDRFLASTRMSVERSEVAGMQVKLAAEGPSRLTGYVQAPGGTPIPGADVWASAIGSRERVYLQTSDDGRFVAMIPDSRYRVFARAGDLSFGMQVYDSSNPGDVVFASVGERVVTWTRTNAVPLGMSKEDMDCDDLQSIISIARGARVIGLGEATHGTN